MTHTFNINRIVVLALSLALIAVCLGVPAGLAQAERVSSPSTVSREVAAPALSHALRADGSGLLQRLAGAVALAFVVVLGAMCLPVPAAAIARIAAPGSFERPLRI